MDRLASVPLTLCLSKVTLAAGTTTTVSNTGTITFAIKGKAYSKSAMTNAATPTTDALTGSAFTALSASKGTVVVIGLDKDGALKACQGPIVDLDSANAFVQAPSFPLIPDTMCPIGYIVLKAGSTLSGTFTFGSSNLSGVTGMTYTFVDVIGLPDRPQIS
jgi:hypothetical protein